MTGAVVDKKAFRKVLIHPLGRSAISDFGPAEGPRSCLVAQRLGITRTLLQNHMDEKRAMLTCGPRTGPNPLSRVVQRTNFRART